MTKRTLTKRSLVHFWRTNLAVAAGIAIATATLAGSSIVGESVRASLLRIATGRLGNTGTAILANQPFTEELAKRIGGSAAPALFFESVIKHQSTNRTAGKVLVYGVDERFWRLHGVDNPLQGERDAVFSTPLAEELSAQDGEGVLVRIEKPSEIPQETLHARREESVRNVRFRVRKSLPDSGIGGFTLQPKQGAVRAMFVPLATLQKELDLAGRSNLIVMQEEIRSDIPLLGHLRLEDVGLRITRPKACRCVQLESPSGLLRDDQVKRALETAKSQGLIAEPFLIYLANSIRGQNGNVPYSLVVARAGVPDGTILLNEWAAWELRAKLGDSITLDYFLWKQEGLLKTESSSFVVNGVRSIPEIGDREMAPEFPGISDTMSLSDWDPPFPMDLNRIRQQDEVFWDLHRTTPKAAISFADGQRLWQTRFGKVTAIRFFRPDRQTIPVLNLTPSTDLAVDGITLLEAREQALRASAGTTDFGEYFGYFSSFLVISALLLTSLFFRFGVEQRLREMGLYLSLGLDWSAIRRIFLREGIVLGVAGALAGTVLGILYSAFILFGLRTWWVDAVGTTGLTLHFSPKPFTAAILQGVVLAVVIIWLSMRRLRKMSARQLQAGLQPDTVLNAPAWLRTVAFVLLAFGLTMLAASALRQLPAESGFFGAGFALLLGGALFCRLWLESPRNEPLRSIEDLALASAAERPGRSFLTVLLISAAVFLLVALESFRHTPDAHDPGKDSGTGGYPLLAESQWPVYQNLDTAEGRAALNVDEDAVRGMRVASFRVRPGDDTSCLNLYQPARPKIAGVPAAFRAERRFRYTPSDVWDKLGDTYADGSVPAIVDNNTMLYVLHKQIGDEIVIPHGVEPVRLRIAGTLSGSIFQSEILIAEENFVRLFPEEQGQRLFLIDAPEAMWGMVTSTLENALSDSGFDVAPAHERLAQYYRVENTYLSTFQALGALGLLLGTIGLAAILMRNVLERRRELAVLRAIGYTMADISRLVLAENLALLGAGLILGTLCALLAVTPALTQRAHGVPLFALAVLLAIVAAAGTLAAWIATRISIRTPLLASLRAE